jgi:hypothetical protein
MDWLQAKDAILSFLAAGGLYWIAKELHGMRTSMEDINKNVAMLLERTMQHEKQLERHDERLVDLEREI